VNSRREREERLYRDRENGVLLGVCAGIAHHFRVRPLAIRILAVLALLLQFWPLVLVYLTAGLLLRDRPLTWRGRASEREFWREGHEESWR
jgi:phage shock protein C